MSESGQARMLIATDFTSNTVTLTVKAESFDTVFTLTQDQAENIAKTIQRAADALKVPA